jgi:hypothetical protein
MDDRTESVVITLVAIVVGLTTTRDAHLALTVALAFQIGLGAYHYVRSRVVRGRDAHLTH